MMKLISLDSVAYSKDDACHIALITMDVGEGQEQAEYVWRPEDTFGLAPKVGEAISQWIAEGKLVSSYVPPVATASEIRNHRDELLRQSDWVVNRHIETGDPIPQEWANYRQALRDVTSQSGFPENVSWPVSPS